MKDSEILEKLEYLNNKLNAHGKLLEQIQRMTYGIGGAITGIIIVLMWKNIL